MHNPNSPADEPSQDATTAQSVVVEPPRHDAGRTTLVDTRFFAVLEKIVVEVPRASLVLSYLGVVATLVAFVAYSLYDSARFCAGLWHGDMEEATIGLLSGLDGIMIANGVYLIVAGSYIVYVKDRLDNITFISQSQRPQALRHLSPGTLKEKMAASLIGVSSVNLLQILINVGPGEGREQIDWITLVAKVGIHIVLIGGLYVFARVNLQEEREKKNHG